MNGFGKDAMSAEQRLMHLRKIAPFSKQAAEHLELMAEYSRKQFKREIEAKWKPKGETKAVRLKDGTVWMNQKVEFLTNLFGKEYYWMKDPTGVVYLARVGTDGLPSILV